MPAQFGVRAGLYETPPFMCLSIGAVGLWVLMVDYCCRRISDVVPKNVIAMLGGKPSLARELEAAGLIRRREADGWWIVETNECWSREPRAKSRRSIAPSLRKAIFARDGNRCVQCGATERLTLDHIKAYSLGGSDKPSNLQVLCVSCNSRKGVA